MKNRGLQKRVAALEAIKPTPAACRAALRRYEETGELPEHPALRRIVERVTGAVQEMRDLVTVVPQPKPGDELRSASMPNT